MAQQPYIQQQPAYAQGGPVQAVPQPQYMPVPQAPLSASIQHSSADKWSRECNETLITMRARGLSWPRIQQEFFPNKSPNACRKHYERVRDSMTTDWDSRRLEKVAKAYTETRQETWSAIAAKTGEKWKTVERMCLGRDLKSLQAAARAGSRRSDRASTGSSLQEPLQTYDDSGVSGIDELEPGYDADEASDRSAVSAMGAYGQYLDHQNPAQLSVGAYGHGMGQASHGHVRRSHHGAQLSSVGIGSIINRHDGRQ